MFVCFWTGIKWVMTARRFSASPCGVEDQTSSDFIYAGIFRQEDSLIDNASAQVGGDQYPGNVKTVRVNQRKSAGLDSIKTTA